MVVVCLAAGLAGWPGQASAQLSPGDLSTPHSHLEGLRRCGNCHRLGDRDVRARCLDCHGEIKAMQDGGTGLHGGAPYSRCVDCHVEHQGRDYELVHWPSGQAGFDHGATGYGLEGAHARTDCRGCHRSDHVADPASLLEAGKNLDRTFLGLGTACLSCHADPHAGQFAGGCTSCHDTGTWKPAPLFDHARTPFPLTGLHEPLACAKCHEPASVGAPVVYAGRPHAACTDCHTDPHAGALGPDCASCHTTAGWKQVLGGSFDHAATRYPLEGRHTAVTCAQCHGSRGPRPAFARCADCHTYDHGRSPGTADYGACEQCHAVEGFRPANFAMARHDSTDFPLRGAHLATPCAACHLTSASSGRVVLDPGAAACTDCHRDPHTWAQAAPPTCTACHGDESWRSPVFDHAATAFPLTGRHTAAACAACHAPNDGQKLHFGGESRQCAGCHRDVHEGTMTRVEGEPPAGDCARCHGTTDWLAENFVHDRDSRFALAGAHAGVTCRACHAGEEGAAVLIFRPLATECAACHPTLPFVEERP